MFVKFKSYAWNTQKNEQLKRQRNVSFEKALFHIARGDVLDIVEHPNQEKYQGQQIFVIRIEEYVWLVPFVESGDEIFLKSVIPSRKATKKYLKEVAVMYDYDINEQAVLDSYERGEWRSIPSLKDEVQRYRAYAAVQVGAAEEVQVSLSPEDLAGIQEKARQAGISYQELIALIVHRFVAS